MTVSLPRRYLGALLALATGLVLLVALPSTEAAAAGCLPAGGADQPFATSQAVIDQGADIAINGGGWGHGVGMSQWAAKGAGLLGCNHEQMLTTFFPNTTMGDTGPVPVVRIGLVQKHTYGELTAESGPVTWELSDCAEDADCAGQPALPDQPAGAVWRITSKADGTLVITHHNAVAADGRTQPKVVWEGGDRFALLIAQHEGTVVKVAIQEGGGISHRRVKYGFTEFDSWADEGGRIYAVQNITPAPDGSAGAMERYLWGLAEVPTSWPYETLKTQAVAGRSYAAKRIAIGNRAACRCQLYATTQDQYYSGYTHEENAHPNWKKAVNASVGRVLTYQGTIADTFYSSSHGGSSDDVDHIWTATIPYLTAVDTSRWETYEGVNNPYQRWSVGFTYDQLAEKYGWASFRSIEVVTRAPGGHPTRKDLNGDGKPDGVKLTGTDADGNTVAHWLSGEQLRFASTGLGLRSSLIHVDVLNEPGASPSPTPSPSPTESERTRTGPTIDYACPQDEVPEDNFADVEGSTHRPAIDCVAWWEVARGVSEDRYAPARSVSRAQMATFISRALATTGYRLPADPDDAFIDDDGTTHEHAINQLAEIGLISGTDAEARTYAPEVAVTRGQMATFLTRAYELVHGPAPRGENHFADDEGNPHEVNIDKARTAWIATGTSATTYEPAADVSREQMASFLARLLDAYTAEGDAVPPSQREGDAEPEPSPSPSPSPS